MRAKNRECHGIREPGSGAQPSALEKPEAVTLSRVERDRPRLLLLDYAATKGVLQREGALELVTGEPLALQRGETTAA